MLNAVGREIPEEILERTGKEVFQGNNYKDGKAEGDPRDAQRPR